MDYARLGGVFVINVTYLAGYAACLESNLMTEIFCLLLHGSSIVYNSVARVVTVLGHRSIDSSSLG